MLCSDIKDIKDLGFTFDKPEAFFFYNWFLCLLTI